MSRFRYLILGLALLSIPNEGSSQSVRMLKEELSAAVVSAASCASTQWTGWIAVPVYRSIVWEILFDGDAAPATTSVTMRCETSEATGTANDSGYDLHILSDSATAGTSDSVTHTWSNAVTADERWTWSVSNLPHNYVNCLLTCTAGDANDTITVKHKRISP